MNKNKTITIISVVMIALGASLLVFFGLKMAGISIFSEKAVVHTEKYEHTSANGIETWDSGYVREDLTSIEVVNLMGNGINLGNTMEAYGHEDLGVTADVSEYETYWGQPITTQEIVDSFKEAGFDSLRIPVAWTNMMDYENGDYTIDEAYLDRVEEIINYAINADMYVVINDHWDGGWWGMFGSESQETSDQAMEMYISMWTQIAERYKEYSDYLIFESANEEIGNRLNDTDIATDSGSLSSDECYEMCNTINQTFVDTVRGTGGNNEERFLLIAGYNTDIEMTCDDRFVMPTDTAESKLILSVHYYTPSGYCINKSLSKWGTADNYSEQNTLLAMMTKFTEKGYGVIFGEYAVALKSDGSVKNNTYEYISNFLYNCDLYGYCPMLWDCSSLFVREDLGFFDEDIAALFLSRSQSAQSSKTQEEIVADAQKSIDLALAAAEAAGEEDAVVDTDNAVAWIMFNSNDWNTIYSVGDVYDPDAKTDGLVATDAAVTGEGTYTVDLDFTQTEAGYADGIIFSALAISNGETLFPGYVVTITAIEINGESVALTGIPYTTSDDGICTRVNLYNEWVTEIPEEIRTADGNKEGLSASVVDNTTLGNITTMSVTFDYGPA